MNIKVVTYNLMSGINNDTPQVRDYNNSIEVLKSLDADIIGLEELGRHPTRGIPEGEIKSVISCYAAKLDMTELKGTDNLLNPTGILKTAQDNCAKLFGAEETLFLTGGSSLGLRGAILGCVPRGGKIIVAVGVLGFFLESLFWRWVSIGQYHHTNDQETHLVLRLGKLIETFPVSILCEKHF